ncbi:MAG: AAA family ATPase, partial [Anaerolineae bacterium]|nr:AAA family ATPase [Anaerolineae bacterium]
QERALNALRLGIGIRREGFNLFIVGRHGMGKHTAVRQFLESDQVREVEIYDWCYVYNFDQSHQPRVLCLPPGMGGALAED